MRRNLKLFRFLFANKGQIFTIDGLFALIFIALLIMVFSIGEIDYSRNNLELLKIQKINDLLLTAQYLKIDNLSELENNYLKLFSNTPGYVKINNKRKELNVSDNTKTKTISNSIKYINNSNNKIYIEIGVYS